MDLAEFPKVPLFSKDGVPDSFLFIFVFSIQFSKQLMINKIANDWIRTADLWCQKQLHHNHSPKVPLHKGTLDTNLF